MNIGPGRKLAAIAVPWLFLVVYAMLYVVFVVPPMREGHVAAVCAGAIVGIAFFVFTSAAVTFTRDILLNRWP